MKWNLLTVIVLLVILLYAVKGYRKGFVKTLAAMLCLAVTLVLVYFATPYVRTFLKENTRCMKWWKNSAESLWEI